MGEQDVKQKNGPDKVFISYSWSSEDHKEWVMQLAGRLANDNVDVVLDEWDTAEGEDLNRFMERMVNDPSIDKVLMICDKVYAEKADGRQGGVGTETVIISDRVYRDANQKKFIAIIAEVDNEGNPYIPTYYSGKKYINMSTPQDYEDGYTRLLRNLYHKPEYPRPQKGSTPDWLLKDEKNFPLNSVSSLRTFQKIADTRPNRIETAFNQFCKNFLEDYKTYAKDFLEIERDIIPQKSYEAFHNMIELRNIFVEGLEAYVTHADKAQGKNLISFFEEIYPLIYTRDLSKTSYVTAQFQHMELFVSELMIYTIAVLVEHQQYEVIEELIRTHYFTTDRLGNNVNHNIGIFRFYPETLTYYANTKTSTYWHSPLGHLLQERATYPKYPFDKIIQADLMICMLYSFYYKESVNVWFPFTAAYIRNDRLPFFRKLPSERYFNEVKGLFNVESADELKSKMQFFEAEFKGASRSGGRSMMLGNFLNVDEIAKYY